MKLAHGIRQLPALARQRLERALDAKADRLAAARYMAAIGYDLPLEERSTWLRRAAHGAPVVKHHVAR